MSFWSDISVVECIAAVKHELFVHRPYTRCLTPLDNVKGMRFAQARRVFCTNDARAARKKVIDATSGADTCIQIKTASRISEKGLFTLSL